MTCYIADFSDLQSHDCAGANQLLHTLLGLFRFAAAAAAASGLCFSSVSGSVCVLRALRWR